MAIWQEIEDKYETAVGEYTARVYIATPRDAQLDWWTGEVVDAQGVVKKKVGGRGMLITMKATEGYAQRIGTALALANASQRVANEIGGEVIPSGSNADIQKNSP